MRSLFKILPLLTAVLLSATASATPDVTLVHCLYQNHGQDKWGLVFFYAAIGRNFNPGEWIRMSARNNAYVATGTCMKVSATDSSTLDVVTKEVRATSIKGFDDNCDAIGESVEMYNEVHPTLERGRFVESYSHSYKTGDADMRLHTYFVRYDQLDKDMTTFPGKYCRSAIKGVEHQGPISGLKVERVEN